MGVSDTSASHKQVLSLDLQVSTKSRVIVVKIKVKSSPCYKSNKVIQVIIQVEQVTRQVMRNSDDLSQFLN